MSTLDRVNPVFAATLAAFSGRPVKPHKVTIEIEPYEVEIKTAELSYYGEAEYHTVTAPDFAMKEAVEAVLAYPSVIDMIESKLAEMMEHKA